MCPLNLKGITPKNLSERLIKKHKEFIKHYQEEYKLLDRILILEEKKDQLDYWIKSTDDESSIEGIMKQIKKADDELTKLKRDYERITGSSYDNINIKRRYDILKNKIEEHHNALIYWKNQTGNRI